MVLWKNYGIMGKNGTNPKTMYLRFARAQNMVDKQNCETMIYNGKIYGNKPKQLMFLNTFIALQL